MISTTTSQPVGLMGLMESLSDQTRLRLLYLLEREELGVAELCEILQMPQSTVSRHLKLLGEQGWVQSRRRGTTNLYRMNLDELDETAHQLWHIAREQTSDWAALEQDRLRLEGVLKQRAQDPRAFFADAARQWDRMRRELYGTLFTQYALLSLLPADWTVADLGCGTGSLTATLAPHVAAVIGVDQSDEMLQSAQHNAAGCDNVVLKRGDLESLPVESESCDAALMLIVLTYVPDPAPALREAARILRPGGKLVVVDLLRHDDEGFRQQMGQYSLGFDRRQLSEHLGDAGLSAERAEAVPPESEAKGPALMLATGRRQPTGAP